MGDILISASSNTLQVLPMWQNSDTTVFICHPHPLYGGTMHNKVVTTLARFYKNKGYSVVLFNFRGVGQSTGVYTGGQGELEDLYHVITWAQVQQPATNIILAGFSFGSYIAFLGAQSLTDIQQSPFVLDEVPTLKQVVLAAPPIHHYNMQDLTAIRVPVFVIIGDADEIVPSDQVVDWCKQYDLPYVLLEQCSHFFHGKLTDLTTELERYAL